MAKEVLDNKKLAEMLPDLQKEFSLLSSTSFVEYEDKLSKATAQAIDALQDIITDGTLAMDPEQLVKATDVLTKAKVSIVDSKRKLMETLIKGQVMIKALEPPKESGNSSVLEDYLARQRNIAMESQVDSIFADIDADNKKNQ